MVVANASNAQVVLDALTERAAGFDAEVRDDRDAYALIAVQGPESPGILKSLTDADLDGLKYYAGLPGTVAGVPALIARTGYTGEDGFELFVAPEHAEQLWQALTEAGAPRRPGPVRAVLPRHAAPGGGHAAVRARADHRADPVRRGARPGREVREGGRLRRPRRRWRPPPSAPRPTRRASWSA